MLMEIVPGASASEALPADTDGASPGEAPSEPVASFADLLEQAAAEAGAALPDGQDQDDEVGTDDCATVPVAAPILMPFVTPLPEASATDSSAIGEPVDQESVAAAIPAVTETSFVEAARGVEPVADDDAAVEPRASAPVAQPVSEEAAEVATPTRSAGPSTVEHRDRDVRAQSAAQVDLPVQAPEPRMHASVPEGDEPTAAAMADGAPAGRKAATPPPANSVAASSAWVMPRVDGESPNVAMSEEATAEAPSRGVGALRALETRASAESAPQGAAARLVRALEHPVHVPTGLDEALQAGQAASWNAPEGHGQQRSLGEWLRERLSGAIASGRQPLTPVFTVGAGAPVDLRLAASPGVGGAQPSDLPQLRSERDVTAQLIQSLRLQFRDGIGEAVLRLKPEHLGSVSISLRVENGGLKANVQAELPAVRQWLESHQDVLRSALAEHGLRLDRFVVDPDGRRDGSSANQSGDEESPHRRRPPQPSAEDQPIFEVVA